MDTNYKKRVRVNFSTSVKGVVTPDITIECLDPLKAEDVLKEAEELHIKALLKAESMSKVV